MKSNLKEQVADHQKDLNELFKRVGSLQDTINNHLVTRLQKLDKELVDVVGKFLPLLKSLEEWRDRQKQTNEIFFDQFKEFVSGMNSEVSPEEAMTMYQEMLSKFLKLSEKHVELKESSINQCGLCEWIKMVQNEDNQTIGICKNPHSIQYKQEVLAEENCIYFNQCLSGGGAK